MIWLRADSGCWMSARVPGRDGDFRELRPHPFFFLTWLGVSCLGAPREESLVCFCSIMKENCEFGPMCPPYWACLV